MSTRQRRLTAMTVGIGCAAMAGGIAVTAQAMASGGEVGTGAQVGVVSVGSDGSDAFQCTFDDVDLGELLPAGAPAGVGTLVVGGVEAVPAGTVDQSAVPPLAANSGQGTIGGLVTPPPLDAAGPVILGQSQIREGTDEECAALREQGLPLPPTGAALVTTGQSQIAP